eukprot:s1252_g3.t1
MGAVPWPGRSNFSRLLYCGVCCADLYPVPRLLKAVARSRILIPKLQKISKAKRFDHVVGLCTAQHSEKSPQNILTKHAKAREKTVMSSGQMWTTESECLR